MTAMPPDPGGGGQHKDSLPTAPRGGGWQTDTAALL